MFHDFVPLVASGDPSVAEAWVVRLFQRSKGESDVSFEKRLDLFGAVEVTIFYPARNDWSWILHFHCGGQRSRESTNPLALVLAPDYRRYRGRALFHDVAPLSVRPVGKDRRIALLKVACRDSRKHHFQSRQRRAGYPLGIDCESQPPD